MSNPYYSSVVVAKVKRKPSKTRILGKVCMFFALFGIWLIVKEANQPTHAEVSPEYAAGQLFVPLLFCIAGIILLWLDRRKNRAASAVHV